MADTNGYRPSEIVDMAIDHTGSRQFWDIGTTAHKTALYRYLNRAYKEVYNAILDLDKNYFRDYRVADIEAGQTEYSLEKVLSQKHVGQYKVEAVYIKYDHDDIYVFTISPIQFLPQAGDRYGINQTIYEVTSASGDKIYTKRVMGDFVPDQYGYLEKVSGYGSTPIPYKAYDCPCLSGTQSVDYPQYNGPTSKYHTFCRITDYDMRLRYDAKLLADTRPESDPFAIISADSVFVYPAPKKPITGGIKFEGAKKMYELDDTMQSEDVLIPNLFHELLMIGMCPKMFKYMKLAQDAQDAQNEYDTKLQTALDRLDTRQTTPVLGTRQQNQNFE